MTPHIEKSVLSPTLTGVLFGTIMTLYLLSSFRSYYSSLSSSSSSFATPPNLPKHSLAVAFTRPSLALLFRSLAHFGLVLGLCYLCEFHPPNFHGEKLYDRDAFFFLTFLLIFAAALTVKENGPDPNYSPPKTVALTPAGKEVEERSRPRPPPDSTVLNRDQTEEWKGWMQVRVCEERKKTRSGCDEQKTRVGPRGAM